MFKANVIEKKETSNREIVMNDIKILLEDMFVHSLMNGIDAEWFKSHVAEAWFRTQSVEDFFSHIKENIEDLGIEERKKDAFVSKASWLQRRFRWNFNINKMYGIQPIEIM